MIDEKDFLQRLKKKYPKGCNEMGMEINTFVDTVETEINNQPQVQPIVKTQADRIRNMSDEELAEFLEKIASGNRSVIGTDCKNDKCESWKCTECILTYLQSEVKEV